jgi:hypothetical protein
VLFLEELSPESQKFRLAILIADGVGPISEMESISINMTAARRVHA